MDTLQKRFDDKWLEHKNGCWIWLAATDRDGYGVIGVAGKQIRAHRLSYELRVGQIPKGHHICHQCDTPSCVNPDHLFHGTHLDNVRDRVEKGRSARQKGESHGQAVLTEVDIIAIRLDERPLREIASDFGMCKQHISKIKRREIWSHI